MQVVTPYSRLKTTINNQTQSALPPNNLDSSKLSYSQNLSAMPPDVFQPSASNPKITTTVNSIRFGLTPEEKALYKAAKEGDIEEIGDLFRLGTNIEAKDGQLGGITPLFWSSWHGKIESIKELLKLGADVHAKDKLGRTSLFGAAHRSHTDVIDLLIESGANPNETDNSGKTPLHKVSSDFFLIILKQLSN